MIPGKPEDFPATHGGFEGQEESEPDLVVGSFVAKRLTDGRYIVRTIVLR